MHLKDYLKREKLTYIEFAKHLDCTSTTVFRIIAGTQYPKMDLAMRIVELTDGEVSLDDIYSDRPKKPVCPCCGHKLGKKSQLKLAEEEWKKN